MTVKSGQSVTVLFATADATSGAAADATVGPVGTLYVDGTASAAVVTVANITTGLYKATVTLPTLTAGQIVSLRIAATVGAAGEGVVWQDGADTTLASDLAAVLPSAAPGTAGGLPILGSNAADMTLNIAGNLTGTVNGLTSAAQADVRTAVGLANADLDTQLSSAATAISGVTATVAISAAQATSVSTGTLAIRTYHSLRQAITSTATAAMNTATKIWLAVKITADDADAESILFIEAAAGLSVLAGAAYATPAHGGLVLSGNAGAWSLAVVLDEAATAQLGAFVGGSWPAEVKALVGSDTVAYWDGRCDISAGIVRLYA